MTTRRVAAVAALALLTPLLAAVQPAAASWYTGAATTLVSAGCSSASRYADAAVDDAGGVHSFASFHGGSCTGSRIRYGSKTSTVTTAALSPYTGVVLSTAVDETAAWVLFRGTSGTRLGRRTHADGAWHPSQLLSSVRSSSGDLVAQGGLWWAVWSEVTSGSLASLFEARTIGGATARTQVTFLAAMDTAPALSVRPSGAAFLAFARRTPSTGVREIHLFDRATPAAGWSPLYATTDGDNHEPDVVALSDTIAYAAWRHGTRVVTAHNRTGQFGKRTHDLGGRKPRITTSNGRIFVAWTTFASPSHVVLAERSGDHWLERDVTPDAPLDRLAAAVVARSGSARVAIAAPLNVTLVSQLRPSIISFYGLGTWVDRLDYSLDPEDTVAAMDARGVKTIYLQTSKFDQFGDIMFRTKAGHWIEEAHARGIRVVGWYFPGYGDDLDLDVRRTLAIASFRTPSGQRFDALGIDIERRGAATPSTFNADVTTHLQRVRAGVGSAYPISAIVQAPLAMQTAPGTWAGFPWSSVGRYADVVQPMGYWTFRHATCPSNPNHCPYGYSKGNVLEATRLTGLPAHEVGGIHNEPAGQDVTVGDVQDFVDGTNDAEAIGGSLYDYRTTLSTFWAPLAGLN